MSNLPISDYGLIGNTRTAALVSKQGSIDWCCFPRFDSPGFFSRLLDPRGGHFTIHPVTTFDSKQQYLDDTNILETVFTTSTGSVRILDCFTVDYERNKHLELSPSHEILRIVEGLSGTVHLLYDFSPLPGFGNRKFNLHDKGKLGIHCECGSEVVVLNHDVQSKKFTVSEGEKKHFSLSYNSTAPAVIPPLGENAQKRFEKTLTFWEDWIHQCTYKGAYEKDVKRSVLALKLLTYSPSGAIIAAPTTSLPETIHGKRNWDYRYCWLRDASFTIRTFLGLGYKKEAQAYLDWILHSTALTHPRLQVLYTIYGEASIPEKIIAWFKGYMDSPPVRIGNAADAQFQLDIYGEVMDAVFAYSPYMEKFSKDSVAFIKGIADSVCELWEYPDEGIWEIRSGKKHHTHSKAMAALALKSFIQLAEERHWKIKLKKYKNTFARIMQEIEEHGYNSDIDAYTCSFDDDCLDASLLTLPLLSVPLRTERLKSTILKIHSQLSQNDLVYRYLKVDDGFHEPEGAFGACSFWMVACLSRFGKKEEAKRLMDSLVSKESPTGLWPEEMDPANDFYLGNFPQAFSHTALISAALSLQENTS